MTPVIVHFPRHTCKGDIYEESTHPALYKSGVIYEPHGKYLFSVEGHPYTQLKRPICRFVTHSGYAAFQGGRPVMIYPTTSIPSPSYHYLMNPIHLGDGVYAKYDGAYLVLITNKHIYPADRVCIELHGLPKLQEFISQILELREAQQP